MEKKESKKEDKQSSVLLKNAVLDAERLLAYAAEFGIKINEKYIKSLVGAKRLEQTNSWTEKEETEFWVAFQILSKTIQPVSVDSIRASSEPLDHPTGFLSKIFRKKRSLVRRSVKWYTGFALVAMIVMIALQVYSIIGTDLLSKVTYGNERMLDIEKRMNALVLITSSNPEDRTARNEKDNLELELDERANEVNSGIQLLDDWLKLSFNIWSEKEEVVEKNGAVADEPSFDGPPPFETTAAFDGSSVSSRNIVVKQQSKSLLTILNQYILPLLYGLFGGFAFVLRSISAETKNMTFTPASNIKFGLRIHLGALAGLVVGFLWGDFDSQSLGIINSLSPLAVAFLAGYSVDFLFKTLDSLIGTTAKKVNVDTVENSKETLKQD